MFYNENYAQFLVEVDSFETKIIDIISFLNNNSIINVSACRFQGIDFRHGDLKFIEVNGTPFCLQCACFLGTINCKTAHRGALGSVCKGRRRLFKIVCRSRISTRLVIYICLFGCSYCLELRVRVLS